MMHPRHHVLLYDSLAHLRSRVEGSAVDNQSASSVIKFVVISICRAQMPGQRRKSFSFVHSAVPDRAGIHTVNGLCRDPLR
jgi:hypothetical protein